MAYMSQEKKKEIQLALKPILSKYNVKGTLSVNNHSTLVLTITQSPIDFIENYNKTQTEKHYADPQWRPAKDHMDVNHYWYKEQFSDIALDFLKEIMPIMNNGNHDNSDSQSDYFDVGWYVDINIGGWNKPYQLIKAV
jgi:hypothetical protein